MSSRHLASFGCCQVASCLSVPEAAYARVARSVKISGSFACRKRDGILLSRMRYCAALACRRLLPNSLSGKTRLISKAPELLEKLTSAVGWMEHLQWIEEMNGRQPYPDLAEGIQAIHELIKEATGDE